MSCAIEVHHLSKRYARYHPYRPTTLLETIVSGLRHQQAVEHYWALTDVSFSIPPGRMVGVIGVNGAGKSTLLRLLGGIGRPDRGTLHVHGRIGALFDLGTGFHPDLTGRENVFVAGIISGLTRNEVARRFDEIVDFAELAGWIDDPLRTYSTGMQLRLAFAIASHIQAEILLIDEVLSVGDIAFQHKCLERIAEFRRQGCTVLIVTHDTDFVAQFCDEALWLHQGRIVGNGAAKVIVSEYIIERTSAARQRTPVFAPLQLASSGVPLMIKENRFGSLEIEITYVRLLNESGEETTRFCTGQPLSIEIQFRAVEPISAPNFGISLMRDGLVCTEFTTHAAGLQLPTLQGEGQITLRIDRLDLAAGLYYMEPWIYEKEWRYLLDYHEHTYALEFFSTTMEKGVMQPPYHWEVEQIPMLKPYLKGE
jgi:lipopolysaccharide transport system ATP-binding protein